MSVAQDQSGFDARYAYYADLVGNVDRAVEAIRQMPSARCIDVNYLEHEFIPTLGLNDELLNQQPKELSQFFGKGLHIWQYPNQLSRYLVWLAFNARAVKSYMEIGCRWGGTFIVITEWLRKIGAPLEFAVAVDPIPETPFVQRYRQISEIPVQYLQMYSNSKQFLEYQRYSRPDMVFVDGDHEMAGVMTDHIHARRVANIIVHHDVSNQACVWTSMFWQYLKNAEDGFEATEFTHQYPSVAGNYLGIGVLKRKAD
jgi:hypothetical protein